jgi:hypothetical protein
VLLMLINLYLFFDKKMYKTRFRLNTREMTDISILSIANILLTLFCICCLMIL